MAQLLGTKYCIESLLQDVLDVQETVTEVCSRVGQVRFNLYIIISNINCVDTECTQS